MISFNQRQYQRPRHLAVYAGDHEDNRIEDHRRRKKSLSRLVGALAVLGALSMMRLEPGAIRRLGRRVLECSIGYITVPEDYIGYYETNYDPIIDYDLQNRVVIQPPPTDIGYVVPIPNCPEAFVSGQIDPGRAFFDSMAMMKLNVNLAHDNNNSTYTRTFYAIVHPDGVVCDGPDGTQYDRVAILEDLGFWVKIWGENVNATATDPQIETAIGNDPALNDLATLNAFTLDDHQLNVILEPTTQILDSPDPIFDQMLADPDAQIMMTPQHPPPGSPTPAPGTPEPVNTDFIVLKPNQTTFDAIQQDIQDATYDPVTGLDGSGVTDLSTSGILAKHYADNPDNAITLDPCSYGDAINDPSCTNLNFTEMKVATLSETCGEPWNCDYDSNTMPEACRDSIEAWHAMRADFEQECLSAPVSVSSGTLDTDIYHGHCNASGFDGYQIMLPDNAVCFGEQQTITDTKVLPGVLQTQTFSLVTQLFSGNGHACVEGTVTIPQYVPPFNIAIVIDVSGSTGGSFGGTPVGNPNGDGRSNTILDAEIDSIIKMIQSIAQSSNLNNNNVDIGLIKFSQSATFMGHWGPADPDNSTAIHPIIYSKLTGLSYGGITNFDDALDKAIYYFENKAPYTGGSNLLFFLSDGIPNTCGDDDNEGCTANTHRGNNHPSALTYTSELESLAALGVHTKAIGVGTGSDVSSGSGLDMINTEDSLPQQVTSSDALVNVLTANPVEGSVVDFAVTQDGVQLPDIDVNDVLSGPTGFSYGPITLDGVNKTYGAQTTLAASLTMDLDGNPGTTNDQVVFSAQATVTGTITNLAMTSRRRLSVTEDGPEDTKKEICKVYKRYAGLQ